MPGVLTPLEQQFMALLNSLDARLGALERSQQAVYTDPTGVSGDPANGHAVVVIGSLAAICGIHAFGIAAWTGSAWQQLT